MVQANGTLQGGDGMSYIVPKDKPNKCTNCIYMDRITYDCKLMYGDDYPDFETQYNNCPLIEIPTPHGRLIDADKLSNQKYEYIWTNRLVIDADDLDDAPTVIEAEGSEE